MNEDLEVTIDFTDITMAETDGVFEDVKAIMILEPPYDSSWMIKSSLTIESPFGIGFMVAHFYGDGRVLIADYDPSNNDVFYNPDIRSLSAWAQEYGWKNPQPNIDLVKNYKDFWKHFWETYLIDCDYFDKVYGKRDILDK